MSVSLHTGWNTEQRFYSWCVIQVSNVIPAKRGKELHAFEKKEKESMRERTAVRNVASAMYSAQIPFSWDVRKE